MVYNSNNIRKKQCMTKRGKMIKGKQILKELTFYNSLRNGKTMNFYQMTINQRYIQ